MEDRNRIAVVTGGTTGIGLAVVREFLEQDYRVAFFGRDEKRLEKAEVELRGRFAEELFIGRRVDIQRSDNIQVFFDEISDAWGCVSVLVNNAGISPKRDGKRIPLHETALDEWQDVFATNLTGAFVCTQQVLPGMIDAAYGRIVMIGSIAARMLPQVAGAAYVASKAGLGGLSRSIASEYSRFGITANLIAPGNIVTDMTGGSDSPANRAAVERIPIGRLGQPSDIAGTVMFLCSPAGAFLNGATIDVNGGELVVP